MPNGIDDLDHHDFLKVGIAVVLSWLGGSRSQFFPSHNPRSSASNLGILVDGSRIPAIEQRETADCVIDFFP